MLRALRAVATGFLSKGVEPVDLLDAVRVVASGEALLSPRATRSLFARFLDVPDPTTLAALTASDPGGVNVSEAEHESISH